MRIVFMGTPEFAVPALRQLVTEGYEVAAVYTRPDMHAGRNRQLVASPVKREAERHGLVVVQPKSLRKEEAVKELSAFRPDVIVLAAYGLILPKAVLDAPQFGALNIHPSLLPKYRGAAPIPAAIMAGDDFAGVSIMLMDPGMDTGPVVAQAQVSISKMDTTLTLTDKLSLVGAQVMMQVLPDWVKGRIETRPQNPALATSTCMLTKESGNIDWHLPVLDVWRRIRAAYPWPGGYTTWQGKQLKIIESMPMPGLGGVEAGKVVELKDKEAAFGIGAGDGVLGIVKVQMQGKRAMTSEEFLRGQKQLIGEVLPD